MITMILKVVVSAMLLKAIFLQYGTQTFEFMSVLTNINNALAGRTVVHSIWYQLLIIMEAAGTKRENWKRKSP
jgi:hypothetical protein